MRLLRRLALAAMIVSALVAAGAWLALRASLPQLDGTLTVAGAEAPIEIRRDRHGVPHIAARSERDAWFGLGFVHGQDRLSQLALSRLAGRGELASVFGAGLVGADRYFRTLGLARVAARNVSSLPAEALRLIEAYAAGIDAAAAARPLPPPELLALGHRLPPWTVADSLLVVKLMALRLAGNAAEEALRAEMKAALAPEVFATAWPGAGAVGEGSNNWVVAGARSESGAPLLANDPHLGLEAPSVWYLAHLAAPGLDVLGATIPGIPAVVVGRNRHAAWGVTSTGADVQDLVAVTDADVTARRVETIVVRGGDAERLEVVETAFGPVVSGFRRFAGAGRAALSWTALADDDATLAAGLRLARAGSIADAFAALEDFHGPAQNFVLADRRGGIGFTVAGSIPVRRGHDGWLPVAAAKGGWTGRLPYAELPRLRDPPGGAIVTANQDISPPGWPHFIARDWAEDYRARRIASVLAAREKHTVAGFMALQTDTVSLMAREFLPLMLPAVADSPWAARLAAWDGAMDPDLAEPLVFQAWFRAFAHALFDRNLAPFRDRYGGRRPATVRRVLTADPSWCGGPPPGDCGATLARALEDGLARVAAEFGANPAAWRWGEAHRAVARHLPTDRLPLLRRLFAVEREHGGGPYTVMQANTRIDDARAPFAETHGASLRAVFDLGDPDGGRLIVYPGQSGHPLSPHYADLADLWARGDYLTLPMTPEAIAPAAAHTLRLSPRFTPRRRAAPPPRRRAKARRPDGARRGG